MAGKVLLIAAVELTEEMLAWPIFDVEERPYEKENTELVRTILKALLSLDGFITCISKFAYFSECRLIDIIDYQNSWVKIYFNSEIIVQFPGLSLPFYRFDDRWRMGSWMENVLTRTVDEWKAYFLGEIERVANSDLEKAEEIIKKNRSKKILAESILRHIGKLPEEKSSGRPLHELILSELATSIQYYCEHSEPQGRAAWMICNVISVCLKFLLQGKIPADKISDVAISLNRLADHIHDDPFDIRQEILDAAVMINDKRKT